MPVLAPAFCIITGKRGTYQLALPEPRYNCSRTDVDELDDSWHSDWLDNPKLTEGCQHPLHPGLILDVFTPTLEVPEFDGNPGSYTFACKWIGDARGKTPTKFISRGSSRTIGVGFDQFSEKYLSWNAHPMPITGTASTNTINHAGNTFANGDAIAFPALTGSSLQAGSSSALAATYYVINRTIDAYQVSATKGGSVISLGSNITAGYVLDARFVVGTVHPLWPNMMVTAAAPIDTGTRWRNVDVTYTGMQFGKPFHRIITCGSVQMSSSDPIAWDFPGGWTTELNSNVQLPEIGCVDTYLGSDTLPTELVPSASASVGTPPDPPDIISIYITVDDSKLIHNWPNGWSIVDVSHSDTINSQAGVSVWRKVWRFIFPVSIK